MWAPEGKSRGLVHIIHGMAEHSARYGRLADALVQAGWSVIAHDQRGHGETARTTSDLGFFAPDGGWDKVVDDVVRIREAGRSRASSGPVVLLGHSMGSYVAQSAVLRHGGVEALVLTGTTLNQGPLVSAGRRIARFERWRVGPRSTSWLLTRLSFGQFARTIPSRTTDFDWLSRDPAEVKRYIDDPLCGFDATTQLWIDLLDAFKELADPVRISRIPADLPILVMCGSADPVNEQGRGFRALQALYERCGLRHATFVLDDGARHEVFNETNRDTFTQRLVDFLGALPAGS
jgi:alpha-beta hydrolase superfamily lysophospholipase